LAEIDPVERMLLEVQNGASRAFVGGQPETINYDRVVECHFNFEPRLRYLRYVTAFNDILNRYTAFDFEVQAIKNGCIDVFYLATNFDSRRKNLVRRQIAKMIREVDLLDEYSISKLTIFGGQSYPLQDDDRNKKH